MDRNIFLNMDIDSQIEYLNKELSNGLTVTRIRDNLHIGEKQLQRIVKEGGYKYNTKTRNYTKVTEVVQGDRSNQVVVSDNSNQIVVSNAEYQNMIDTMKSIKDMSNKLEEVYKWYELQNNVIEKAELKIDSNNHDTVTRSFKVYEDVYKDFIALCDKHSTFKKQDILTQALKEFVNKYK